MRIKIPQTKGGFSLVEVLVSLGVFVLGTATIGLLVIDAGVASRRGLERAQAIFLAQEGL